MSIDKLKQRLEQQLSHSLAQEVVHTKFVKPQKLIKTLYVLEQRFDDFENAIPLDQKIFRTISKFQDSGFHSLSKRDWKNLAWALSKILPDTENKLGCVDIYSR